MKNWVAVLNKADPPFGQDELPDEFHAELRLAVAAQAGQNNREPGAELAKNPLVGHIPRPGTVKRFPVGMAQRHIRCRQRPGNHHLPSLLASFDVGLGRLANARAIP